MRRLRKLLISFAMVLGLIVGDPPADAQWVARDHRWQPRGAGNWALPEELPQLYREFNGIDFGHAHLAETLLRTQDPKEVEQARLEVLDFIFSSPAVPPDEEQGAPTFTRMVWEAQRAFNWAHGFHRSLYDLFASDRVQDKESEYRRLLANYLEKPEAITSHRLDHHGKLRTFPESRAFRDTSRTFNTQIWAYHWLQASTYDVQLLSGELAVEVGAGFMLERRGPERGFFPVEVLYGAYPNLQLGLGTTLLTDPHEVDEQTKSGDLRVSGLYNLNQETLTLPAFGVKLELNLPTGVDSAGVDVEVKGIMTKSFDRLSLHLNAGYEFLSGTTRDERDGRYKVTLGASYPVSAPQYTRTTLIGDVFTEPGSRRGGPNAVGAEVGFCHQLTQRTVVDAGIGSELAGPADRSSLSFTSGVSVGF